MTQFSVHVADRDTKPHSACFDDFARALTAALTDLGHLGEGRRIFLGANDAASRTEYRPDDVFFNAEQVAVVDDPLKVIASPDRSRVIWDYSRANVEKWRALGFERVVHCPIGYHPSMELILSDLDFNHPPQDIDVLFYGWVNVRRREILDKLKAAGLRVFAVNGIYGIERNFLIVRAKVVLNLHFFESAIFEIFRCANLFASRKCVVTELDGLVVDEDLEELAFDAACCSPRESIVRDCLRLVSNEGDRREVAEAGGAAFKKTSLTDSVRRAIAATEAFE